MIIKSLLDTDLYKFTMGQVALHQFPWVTVKYEFKCRNKVLIFDSDQLKDLLKEIKSFCTLRFTEDELSYLSKFSFIKQSYIDFLRLYQPDIKHIRVAHSNTKGLEITIEGPWFLTIYWEVPMLAMVNEIYGRKFGIQFHNCREGWNKLAEKCSYAKEHKFAFADFGTRRRASQGWQNNIVAFIKESNINFVGTSNVQLAKKFGVNPIGTMAHEFLQVGQALDVPLIDSQKRMLQSWVDEYRGDLGIALTDIIGIDAFLKDFDLYFAKLYDGLRHDSGDPTFWASMVIQYYIDIGIDPRTKKLVFSDGLDFEKCKKLHQLYKNSAQVSFGIGTNLTNDFDGIDQLQIVIKMVECNGRPVAKISDSPGKGMCRDKEYVSYLKKVFGVK